VSKLTVKIQQPEPRKARRQADPELDQLPQRLAVGIITIMTMTLMHMLQMLWMSMTDSIWTWMLNLMRMPRWSLQQPLQQAKLARPRHRGQPVLEAGGGKRQPLQLLLLASGDPGLTVTRRSWRMLTV